MSSIAKTIATTASTILSPKNIGPLINNWLEAEHEQFQDFLAMMEDEDDPIKFLGDYSGDKDGRSTFSGSFIDDDESDEDDDEYEVVQVGNKGDWGMIYQNHHRGHENLVVPGTKLYSTASTRGVLRLVHTSQPIKYEIGSVTPILIAPSTQLPSPYGVVPHIIVTSEVEDNDECRFQLEQDAIPWAPPLVAGIPRIGPMEDEDGQVCPLYQQGGIWFEPFADIDGHLHARFHTGSWVKRETEGDDVDWTIESLPKITVKGLTELIPGWLTRKGESTQDGKGKEGKPKKSSPARARRATFMVG